MRYSLKYPVGYVCENYIYLVAIMSDVDIINAVNEFRTKSDLSYKYTSFDYCYKYFRTTEDLTKDMEKSCLELGFYLASWGMLRGSSELLKKSCKHYQKLIEYFSTLGNDVWNIDVDKYDDKKTLKQFYV
jgi:hypothetical protein